MPESQLYPYVYWNFTLATDGPGRLRGEYNGREQYQYTAARNGDGLILQTHFWFEQELAVREMLDLLGAYGNPQFAIGAYGLFHLNGYADAGAAHFEDAPGLIQLNGYALGTATSNSPNAPGLIQVVTHGDGATRRGSAGGTVFVISKTTYQASWQEANRTFVLDDIMIADTATYEEIVSATPTPMS